MWEGRFKSCLIDSDQYFLTCQRYIELNPVRAGIVNDPGKYPWSSYQSNALGLKNALLSEHEIYLSLGLDEYQRRQRYRDLFEDILNADPDLNQRPQPAIPSYKNQIANTSNDAPIVLFTMTRCRSLLAAAPRILPRNSQTIWANNKITMKPTHTMIALFLSGTRNCANTAVTIT